MLFLFLLLLLLFIFLHLYTKYNILKPNLLILLISVCHRGLCVFTTSWMFDGEFGCLFRHEIYILKRAHLSGENAFIAATIKCYSPVLTYLPLPFYLSFVFVLSSSSAFEAIPILLALPFCCNSRVDGEIQPRKGRERKKTVTIVEANGKVIYTKNT